MYRRMYGTRHPVTPHHLIPIEPESWLQKKSMVPTVKRLLLGSLCLILLTVMVFPFGQMGLVPDAVGVVLLLLSGLAVLVALLCLTVLVEMVLCRDPHQYCPDCLSYMTRGAKICPFCAASGQKLRHGQHLSNHSLANEHAIDTTHRVMH